METSYKEKYEQAIERLKQWDREHPCAGFVLSDRDKFIFPELAESEGEKVRKALISFLKSPFVNENITDEHVAPWIAWLEKQGQVKESTISQHENKMCKENDDSLTSEDEKMIKEIIELVMQPTWKTEEEFHRRNVLCAWLENVPVTIDHEKREGFHLGYKACLEKQGEQKFEMKTAEESLGIDSDTYNKIIDECIFGEQKPVELAKGEDYGIDGLWHAQRILEKTFGEVDGYQTDDGILSHECAISAVKELYEKKPAWSEEDERNLQGIIDEIEANKNQAPDYDLVTYDRFLSWLKSLRPQNRWKPSELQLGCLSDAIEHYNSLGYPAPKLKELLDDLKKIKEE